jgi:hypothetical protein
LDEFAISAHPQCKLRRTNFIRVLSTISSQQVSGCVEESELPRRIQNRFAGKAPTGGIVKLQGRCEGDAHLPQLAAVALPKGRQVNIID